MPTPTRPAAALLAAAALTLTTLVPAQAARVQEDETTRMVLVIDASGSMRAELPDGQTRMEAAKAALNGVVDRLPADVEVGLRVYGATEESETVNDRVCADTQLVHPITALDASALRAQINALEPTGWTPLAHSVTKAAEDLGQEGKRHIILVSDGEETCTPDPCPEIRQVVDRGIEVQVDTIGFAVDDTARSQLQCISDVTGGSYYGADDAETLSTALDKATQRALREFNVSGEPVEGVLRSAIPSAPVLTAGQFLDQLETGEDHIKYYRIQRTIPGSRLYVSAVSRPPRYGEGTFANAEGLTTRLTGENERGCDGTAIPGDHRFDDTRLNDVVVSATGSRTNEPRCTEPDSLLLQVGRGLATRQGGEAPIDVEIRVVEEAPVTDDDRESLPEAIALEDAAAAPGADPGPVVDVLGGTSFNNALELAPGTYREHLIPGELVFFRTPVDWGQSATFTVHGTSDDIYVGSGLDLLRIYPRVYTPAMVAIHGRQGGAGIFADFNLDSPPSLHVTHIPEVRYRNREGHPEVRKFGVAGDHYYVLAVTPRWQGLAEGRPVPVEFSIEVDGQPHGSPFGEATPGASGSDTTDEAHDQAGQGGPGTDGAGDTGGTEGRDGTDGARETSAAQADAGEATASDDAAAGADLGSDSTWRWALAGGALVVILAASAALAGLLRRNRT